ncbi:MAG: DUF1553 domain-containing protein [Opitutia bacterium]
MSKPPHPVLGAAALAVAVGLSALACRPAPVATVDFNRDIRPILSDRCYGCHGPDSEKGRKAGLRLDTPEGARQLLESGRRAIDPDNPAASEMIARLHSDDPDEVMPPPELKRPLTPGERELLTRWVREGAVYQPHWAFVAPRAPSAPGVRAEGWARDPLDLHVLARLEREGLAPAAEADRVTLLRRASLVLTGLPPTPEEVDAFAADGAPDAYERRVDALLASEAAAEHMASAWLDLARYADTYGYSGDHAMLAWPWRDWVLRAFRDNLPYDRFVTLQLAGDLVPDANQDTRLATAFNRIHRMTFEGGSIAEEFRQDGIADRVNTYGAAVLGLTMECAKCHDHKYDPISHREYFSLAALFGAIDENGLITYHSGRGSPPPLLRLATPEQGRRGDELRAALTRALADWDAVRAPPTPPGVTVPPPLAHYPLETLERGASPNAVAGAAAATTDRRRGDQLGVFALSEGKVGRGGKLDGDGGLLLAGTGGNDAHAPFSFSAWLRLAERHGRAVIVHASGFYTNDADASGVDLAVADGRLVWSLIHQWPGSALAIRSERELPVGEWIHLAATYDGSGRARGLAIHLNGRPLASETLRDHLQGGVSTADLELGSRSRDLGLRGALVDEVRVWKECLTPAEVAALHGAAPSAEALADHGRHRSPEGRAALAAVRKAARALADHEAALPAISVMAPTPHVRPTHILTRGEYNHPDLRRGPVAPAAIAAVLPHAPGEVADRLGLARWTVSPDNPLTSRVAVNRLWTQVFGVGLVETSENFGLLGDLPSHPEVLDLLAADFAKGWDQRALLRRLVLSASFRQSSTPTPEKLARDPANRLLSRGPSQRMSAEMIRDQSLAASGRLVRRLGGPGVRPLNWGDSGVGGDLAPGKGEELVRRSLYTYRKRTAPPPGLLLFDAGSREVCQPRRSKTNTPLQALALLNDPENLASARALAARVAREAGPDLSARLTRAFRLLAARPPSADELATLAELHRGEAARYAADLPAAKAYAGAADADLAALTLVCSTLLASDAVLTLR